MSAPAHQNPPEHRPPRQRASAAIPGDAGTTSHDHPILQLQRLIGNRATQQMLQREGDDEEPTLNPPEEDGGSFAESFFGSEAEEPEPRMEDDYGTEGYEGSFQMTYGGYHAGPEADARHEQEAYYSNEAVEQGEHEQQVYAADQLAASNQEQEAAYYGEQKAQYEAAGGGAGPAPAGGGPAPQGGGPVPQGGGPVAQGGGPIPQGGGPAGALGEANAAPLLSPAQVVMALSYYRQRAAEYTPDIIRRIQVAVGVPGTGVMDEPSVQAVAHFQSRDPLLKVDGMAGPRTLPAAFPSGLADEERLDSFVEGASEIESKWAEYPDADARVKALTDLVNERLVASGVPACKVVVKNLPGLLGQFDFETWSLEIGRPAFANNTVSNEEAADAADTVYHEARHAEQWFRMAQYLAGNGNTAAQIAAKMQIPPEQAAAAVANPLVKGSMEYLIADGWFQSVYGRDAAKRNQVLQELEDADTALDAANQAQQANPSPANEQKVAEAQARRDAAFDAYQQLPEENDAWRVGGRVTTGMLATDAGSATTGGDSPF